MNIFHNFERSSLPISIIKQNKNNWERNCMWHSYRFMQFYYKPLFHLPKNLEKMTQTAKNTKTRSFFISLSTPSCWPWSQSKIHWVCNYMWHSYHFMKVYSLTCPKSWEKGPKWLKTLKNGHFSYFWKLLIFLSSSKIIHFLTCQKNLGKSTQTAKSTKKRSIFITLNTPAF